MAQDSNILRYVPFVVQVEPLFWQELARRKLDIWKLDESLQPIVANFLPSRADVPPKCVIDGTSFEDQVSQRSFRGYLKNVNTREEFQSFDRSDTSPLLQSFKSEMLAAFQKDPFRSGLHSFLVLSFADLKTFLFHYQVCMPTINCAKPFTQVEAPVSISTAFEKSEVESIAEIIRTLDSPFFSIAENTKKTKPIEEWKDGDYIGFLDSSQIPQAPGFLLRHLLAAFCMKNNVDGKRLKIIGFRDEHRAEELRSTIFTVEVPESAQDMLNNEPLFQVAWQQNADKGSVHRADLKSVLDPSKIAADAVALNVKLMKWRIMPNLEPEKIWGLKFLLLGAGTLGCNVARCLVGWGISHITFVDGGKVSYSNPARQTLFTHKDAAAGRMKSQAAFERLQDVITNLTGSGEVLEIPMPGHSTGIPKLEENMNRLKELIDTHDVVCMLTDSRESRYLPSLIVGAMQKEKENPPLGLTVALGYDSFVVMTQSYKNERSACYFCNDVTAPQDSLSDRSVDQQCTVTRPGLSGMAASIAVELIASLTQHPDGFAAKRNKSEESLLGRVPNQLRGYMSQFEVLCIESEAFKNCVCCSPNIVSTFREDPLTFARRVLESEDFLPGISGLQEMQNLTIDDVDFPDLEE